MSPLSPNMRTPVSPRGEGLPHFSGLPSFFAKSISTASGAGAFAELATNIGHTTTRALSGPVKMIGPLPFSARPALQPSRSCTLTFGSGRTSTQPSMTCGSPAATASLDTGAPSGGLASAVACPGAPQAASASDATSAPVRNVIGINFMRSAPTLSREADEFRKTDQQGPPAEAVSVRPPAATPSHRRSS